MSDFNWNAEDADSVLLPHQPRTAVYSTKGGGICIRQECDGYCDESDDQVLLTPQGALAVAWALIEEAHLVGLPSPSASLMVESPNWPPVTKRTKAQPATDQEPEAGPLLQAMGAAE